MPRVAGPDDIDRVFPWEDWAVQLSKSPTKALFFNSEDFGAIAPYVFQRRARKAFSDLDVTVRVRGEEVLVALNA